MELIGLLEFWFVKDIGNIICEYLRINRSGHEVVNCKIIEIDDGVIVANYHTDDKLFFLIECNDENTYMILEIGNNLCTKIVHTFNTSKKLYDVKNEIQNNINIFFMPFIRDNKLYIISRDTSFGHDILNDNVKYIQIDFFSEFRKYNGILKKIFDVMCDLACLNDHNIECDDCIVCKVYTYGLNKLRDNSETFQIVYNKFVLHNRVQSDFLDTRYLWYWDKIKITDKMQYEINQEHVVVRDISNIKLICGEKN